MLITNSSIANELEIANVNYWKNSSEDQLKELFTSKKNRTFEIQRKKCRTDIRFIFISFYVLVLGQVVLLYIISELFLYLKYYN